MIKKDAEAFHRSATMAPVGRLLPCDPPATSSVFPRRAGNRVDPTVFASCCQVIETARVQVVLDEIAELVALESDRGKLADYIPDLAQADLGMFGIAVAFPDGALANAGNADLAFSVQSVAKVFTLAMALGRTGDALWSRVGREPSGLAFNSSLQLDQEQGRPRNPFINAGALVVTDTILAASEPRAVLAELLCFIREAAEDECIHINKDIARSETATGHRNWSLAHLLRALGNLDNTPERVLGTYFHQCAVEMTCVQLAKAGRFLIGARESALVAPDKVRRINALMMTCGQYDGSGDFAYRVGLPSKSGVSGGLLAIVPRCASVAAWSPGLDAQGNSKLGTLAVEMLAERMGWSVFG
jgi:glutaminase